MRHLHAKGFVMSQSDKFNVGKQPMAYSSNNFEIFLDMDGVISDFGRHVDETGMRREDGTPDYKKLSDKSWYVTMPVYPGARQFYDDLTKIGRVRFLTAPLVHVECFSGKAEWIKNFVPERKNFILRDLMIVASKDKYLVAKPGRVLIDDREGNVKAWTDAGGIGIHHTGDYAQTLKAVEQTYQEYQQKKDPLPPFKR